MKFHERTKKIIKILEFSLENNENHENPWIPCQNHVNHENLRISLEIHKNNENLRIQLIIMKLWKSYTYLRDKLNKRKK